MLHHLHSIVGYHEHFDKALNQYQTCPDCPYLHEILGTSPDQVMLGVNRLVSNQTNKHTYQLILQHFRLIRYIDHLRRDTYEQLQ